VTARRLAIPLLILALGAGAVPGHAPIPLSSVLAYAGLGLLPGLAFANLFGPWSLGARVTLALALSPFITCAIAIPLLGAGLELRMAATWIVAIGALAAALTEALRGRSAEHTMPDSLRGTPDGGYVAWWCLGIAIAVAFPPLVNR
jgi:hypothetical protein